MNLSLWSVPGRVPVKLFFAVRPDVETGAAIEKLGVALKTAHRLRGQPITRERLHNTLAAVHDTGSIRENIARAKAIGDRLWHRRFCVRFDWTGSFRGDHGHPFVLRGDEGLRPLLEFREGLRARMLRAGFGVERGFTPHVTLLWADRCVEDYPIAPITWTVREFVLTLSVQGYSRHIDVARWPLD
jgi:RNA 2',3'-cyclic 3'-phosphodiesterase